MALPSTSDPVRWGVLGTGYAATHFADALRRIPGARLVAVASRSEERAHAFARQFGAEQAYGSAAHLAGSDKVDAVFIATPNSLHCEHSVLCLEAGKHVVCEKPFALSAAQAREVMDCSTRNRRFCMEGMWTRFLPLMKEVSGLVRSREIGEIRLVTITIGHPLQAVPQSHLFSREHGGGALLDIGVYGISLARQWLGAPLDVVATASIGDTGVDEQCSVTMRYEAGAIAAITLSLRTLGANEAFVMGTRGRVHVHEPVISPVKFSWKTFQEQSLKARPQSGVLSGLKASAAVRRFARPAAALLGERSKVCTYAGNGKQYQLQAAVECIRRGELQCDIMPLSETIDALHVMDAARLQFDLKCPEEQVAARPGR